MTEPLVCNHTEVTQELFREGAKFQLNQKYNRMTAKVAVALLAALAALAVLMVLLSGGVLSLAFEGVIFVLVLGWFRIALPRTECKRAYRAFESRCGGFTGREVSFYEDHLVVQPEAGETVAVPYGEVTGLHETRRTLTLTCADGTSVLLDKEGFLQGGTADVESLLGGAL
ncbi:MAG: YcxB family protein [Clostridiales bacterium]|nr:YcxB family protein [Clostridiales bacterium]